MSQTKIDIANLSDNVVAALSVPKISGITYPGDDTAAAPTGGQQITINGSGFAAGALVYVDNTVVGISSVLNSSQIVFTSPAKPAGAYELKVISTDGGTATFNNNIQYSGTPVWATAAGSLGNIYETKTFSTTFSASSDSAVTYAVTSGNLPTGIVITGNSVSGTANIVSGDTTYSFTVDAVDVEKQNTSRNFSIGVLADAVTWNSPANNSSFTANTGTTFTQALSATSAANSVITYAVNTLPAGLTLVGNTISGNLTTVANTTVLITATASTTGKTATRTLNFTVASANTPIGQAEYTTVGTYSWVAPTGVTSICVVAVGGGGGASVFAGGKSQGIAGGNSSFHTILTANGGGGGTGISAPVVGGTGGGGTAIGGSVGGGNGGNGSSSSDGPNPSGGGAGGYSGKGGNAGTPDGNAGGFGGGVGIYGQGANGTAGSASAQAGAGGGGGGAGANEAHGGGGSGGANGSNSGGGAFGGGAGGGTGGGAGGAGGGLRYYNNYPVTPGNSYSIVVGSPGGSTIYGMNAGRGAVRIIWGNGRAFPATNTGNL